MSVTEVPQDRRRVKLFVGLIAAGLLVLVGLIVFSLVSLLAVVFFSASQASCVGPGNDGATGGDSEVPLPATNPDARLQVSIFSWNSYYKNSLTNVLRGFRAIEAAGGDAGGLQEQNSHVKLRDLQHRLAPAWTFVGTQTRHPIAYRTASYQLLASGVEVELKPHKMESGPGGRSVGTKYVVWAELRDVRTRATFILVNDHKVAGVEHSGHPRRDKPIRVGLWHQQDAAVGRVIAKLKPLGVPIFKTADENLAAKADAKVRDKGFGYVQMQKRGMYSNWRVLGYPKEGTHGTRAIDYVWATTKMAAPVRQRVLGKYGSDHSILVVDLDNQKAASTARATAASTTKAAAKASAAQQASRAIAGGEAVGGATRRKQIANAKLVAQGVQAAGGSGRAIYVALVAAVGESDLINVNYGDKAGPDSRGLFQQRDSWGTLAQRMDPAWAAKAFMLGPHQASHGGLLQLTGWEKMSVTLAIHRVQINADPNHYTKFESRAAEIGRQAGIDFDAPAGVGSDLAGADQPACPDPAQSGDPGLAGIGSGPCPLDTIHAPGKKNPRACGDALTWLSGQMSSGSHAWYRKCMALVAVAYGWQYSGNDTAYLGATRVIAAGQMHTSRTNIPKGAVLWWDGHRTGNSAGHVAIYDGNGYIFSNDVKGAGTVGRVPWTFPEDHWGQRFMGWSAPYFPNAG